MSRRARLAAAAVLGLPLGVVAALAGAPAAHASASGSAIACPATTGGTATGPTVRGSGSCGAPVTGTSANGTVTVAGLVSDNGCVALFNPCTVTFAVTNPAGSPDRALGTQSANVSGGASSRTLAIVIPAGYANGTYRATLSGDSANVAATFTLQVPPSPPGGETVEVGSPGRATVTWQQSAPTPADGYAVLIDGNSTTLTPSCTSSSCGVTATGLSGGTHAFTVLASRSDGGSGSVSSASEQDATVTAAPSPTPTPSASGTGTGTGPSTGPSTGPTGGPTHAAPGGSSAAPPAGGSTGKGGTTTTAGGAKTGAQLQAQSQQAQRTAESFHAFAPPAGIALLPPLPQLPTSGTNPNGEPTSPGTYSPTLPYSGSVTATEKVVHTTALGHIQNVVGNRQLIESIAAAVLVLLAAAHLRVFVRRSGPLDL